MNEQSQHLKLNIMIAALALAMAYVGFSSPGKVVIDERGRIKGITNEVREVLQGGSFWKDQARLVQKELDWELGEPARKAKFEREIRQLDAELDRDMRETFHKFPEMRPTPAELQAEALRDRADAIEMAQVERELEIMRRERIGELHKIQQYLVVKLR